MRDAALRADRTDLDDRRECGGVEHEARGQFHRDQCRDEARCALARARRRQAPAKRRASLPSSRGRRRTCRPSARRSAQTGCRGRALPKVRRRPIAAAAPVPAPWPAPEPKSCRRGCRSRRSGVSPSAQMASAGAFTSGECIGAPLGGRLIDRRRLGTAPASRLSFGLREGILQAAGADFRCRSAAAASASFGAGPPQQAAPSAFVPAAGGSALHTPVSGRTRWTRRAAA